MSDPTSPRYLPYNLAREAELFVASMYMVGPGVLITLCLAFIGQQAGGYHGRLAMVDVGVGVMAFGFAGMAIHLVRTCVNIVSQRILFKGQEPLLMERAPAPPDVVRPLIESADWDFVLQAVAAVVVGAIALRLDR